MREVQEILFDVTSQKVYFDAPEGMPSSVTSCEVFPWDMSDDQTPEAAIGAPSVEGTPNDVLTAAAGPSQSNPRSISLASADGLAIGRVFVISGNTGLREMFEVEAFSTGGVITAKHPLHNDYAVTTSTVQSTRIQATIDSTWVADDTNMIEGIGANPMYRVRWVYTASDGVKRVADTYFNLVRYAGRHGVQPQDVEAMMPGWLDSLPTDHRNDQGRRLIDDAYRGVKIDLHQVDLAASNVAESEVIDELVRYKTLALGEWARYMGGSGDSSRAELSDKRYTARLDSLIRVVSRVPVRDSTGAATPVIAQGLSRR